MAELLETRPTRRRLSPGVLLLCAVLLVTFLFMAALGIGWLIAKQRVRAEVARIRAAGEPVTPQDLEAFYTRPPADRDATQLWLDAVGQFEGPAFVADTKDLPVVGEMGRELPAPGQPWPEQSAIEDLLATYQEPLEKMHRAAKLGGAARYPIKFADGYQMVLDHLTRLRAGSRMLQLEAEAQARRHDGPGAAEAIQTMFAAAHSLENEPTIVSQLVRLALDGMARSQLERCLAEVRFSDEQLAEIDRQLAACDYPSAFHRAMLAARVESFDFFSNPSTLGTQAPGAFSAVFRPSDQQVYLQVMQKMVAASQSSGPALHDAMAVAEADVTKLGQEPLARVRFPISLLALPSMQSCSVAVNRGIAYRDAARVALAIERFRLRNNRLPDTLDALLPEFLPEVPLDPFDGRPLRYRVDAAEYKVYSVGNDGIDQGGQTLTLPQANAPSQEDLVFRVRLGEEAGMAKGDAE